MINGEITGEIEEGRLETAGIAVEFGDPNTRTNVKNIKINGKPPEEHGIAVKSIDIQLKAEKIPEINIEYVELPGEHN